MDNTSPPLASRKRKIDAPARESLREQRERIRAHEREHGKTVIAWKPITIPGEMLSTTVIRERRGDFDNEVDPAPATLPPVN